MKHEVTERAGTTVVAFTGDVDLQNAPAARKVLLETVAGEHPVLVDLSGVDYIDSSGVASLVEALQTARKRNLGFALVAVSESALRVFQLAHLDKVFTIHGTLDDAFADDR